MQVRNQTALNTRRPQNGRYFGCARYETKLTLAKGLAMGLEFKLGSEILRTVIVRDWHEIGTVAGIIALRAALTFLIHWEIKEEEKEKEAH